MLPVMFEYFPEGHGVQLSEPLDIAYLPPGQREHTVAEELEYDPAAQLPVTADKPVVAQYDPAVQALHTLNPADAAKVPVEQLVQLD